MSDKNHHRHHHHHVKQQQQQQDEFNVAKAEEAAEENETPWRDDQIRWIGHPSNKKDDEDDVNNNNNNIDGPIDIFADPNPFQTFKFRFDNTARTDHAENNNNSSNSNNENKKKSKVIEIELFGYKEEADAIYTSTGLTLWRASEHLCRYMIEHVILMRQRNSRTNRPKRILELGAGLGLCGILAAQLCPDNPIFITDGDVDTLKELRKNLAHNLDHAARGVKCHQLLWGHDTAQSFLQKQANGEPFDIILASDIIYVECIIAPLWETLRVLMANDGLFVLAFARRQVPVTLDYVLETAQQQAGLDYRSVLHLQDEGVFVYEFQWKNRRHSSNDDKNNNHK